MKKLILTAVLVAGVAALIAQAAQDTALDGVAEVRNPVRLKTWLETNAQDAETRIAAALQPNAVAVTNTIIGVGDVTNVIVVIGGQITSWTVTE